jgi:outer membrane receptor for ferrienterochelin and colicins
MRQFFFLACILWTYLVQSQTTVKCIAPPDSSGLPGAAVQLLKDGAIVYMNSTGANGEVEFFTQPPYILRVKCVGYTTYTDTIRNSQKRITIGLHENMQQLNDVVITAQYSPTSVDNSTYKVKIIDSKRIQELAAVNLKDALSNELNFRFSQDNALSMCTMSMQGISGQNVKVLVDGVPMIGRQDGNLDLSQINLNNVERIEIVEGPMAVNYGTDALAGVVNIITKKPKKNRLESGAQLYYETNYTYNANLYLSFQKKNHGIKISGGRNYFNGWKASEAFYLLPEKTPADTNRFKSWKPREQYFGNFDYTFSKGRLDLAYKASYFNELILSRGFPVAPYYESAFDDHFRTNRIDNALSTNIRLKKHPSFNNLLGYNYYERKKNTYYKDLTSLEEQISPDASMQDTSRFTLWMMRGSFISSKPFSEYKDSSERRNYFNYEAGYDLNYESAFGKRIEGRQQYIADLAAYASMEIQPVRNFIIRPGARYAYNSLYPAPLTPSLHLKYNTDNWIFRSSFARGFRAPTLKELYFNFVDINHNITGNKDLKAETSNNLTAFVKWKKEKEKRNFWIENGYFYNNITNLITLGINSGIQYTYINIGKYITYGTSLNSSFTWKALTVSGGASYTARYNQLSGEYKDVATFSYSPEARGSAQYGFEKIKTTVNVFYKYTGKLPGVGLDANNVPYQTFIGAYNTLDANISTRFFKKKFTVTIGSKNILNVTNVLANNSSGGVHSPGGFSTPIAMGRTYFLKLDYVFSK